MSMDSQDAIFGPENTSTPAQGASQLQLQETDSKMDDSIDNQQQACDLPFAFSLDSIYKAKSRACAPDTVMLGVK